MRKLLLFLIIELFFFNLGFSQEDSVIVEIKKKFQLWQPIIETKIHSCTKFYYYTWGDDYQFNKWYYNETEDGSKTLSKIASIIENSDYGYYLSIDEYSVSGDWNISIDYYYDINEELYFIFWSMNTFYAEIPVTVDKRLYFNIDGEKIREIQSVYKMNTKEKTDISFMDRDVEYSLSMSELDFYLNWKSE
jgi:hypothetical protein